MVLQPRGRAAGGQGPAGKPVAVLAAVQPIPSGGLLRPGDLGWRVIVVTTPPAGALVRGAVSETQFVGSVARRGFAAGEMVQAGGLIAPGDKGFLAAVLTPGSRAVTLAVDSSQSAAGLILPDDRVDVIVVQDLGAATGPGGDPGKASVAQILLHDVRVVAVDRVLNRPPPPAANAPAATVVEPRTLTMEVTELDAQRLFLAQQIGKVQLTVRAFARAPEQMAVVDGPVWGSDIFPGRSSGLAGANGAARARAFAAGPQPGEMSHDENAPYVAPYAPAGPGPGPAIAAPVEAPIVIVRGTKAEAR